MTDNTDIIVVENLHKYFGSVQAVKDVSFSIRRGEVVIVVGPSGSGKSTVLRCLNHLEVPTHGAVYIDGVHLEDKKTNINEIRAEVGMVFQQFNLFNHLTVLENVMLPIMAASPVTRERPTTMLAMLTPSSPR